MSIAQKPWSKPHPMARKCMRCKSQKPGMQPLRLNGVRGFWHLNCFELDRKELSMSRLPKNRMKPQWSDKYGSQWYKHYDGQPPLDDDKSYIWTGSYWAIDWEYEEETESMSRLPKKQQ